MFHLAKFILLLFVTNAVSSEDLEIKLELWKIGFEAEILDKIDKLAASVDCKNLNIVLIFTQ